MPELTLKQQRFIEEYLKTGNLSEAYRRSYDCQRMSERTIGKKAYELFQTGHIAAKVAQLRRSGSERALMSRADVLKEAMRISRFDVRRLFNDDGSPKPVSELDDETAACVAGIEVAEIWEGSGKERVFVGYTKKYRIADKNAALDKLFRHFGLYEKDNKQKADPIRDLIAAISGASLKPVHETAQVKGETIEAVRTDYSRLGDDEDED
jgi:phage terminase small subunit